MVGHVAQDHALGDIRRVEHRRAHLLHGVVEFARRVTLRHLAVRVEPHRYEYGLLLVSQHRLHPGAPAVCDGRDQCHEPGEPNRTADAHARGEPLITPIERRTS